MLVVFSDVSDVPNIFIITSPNFFRFGCHRSPKNSGNPERKVARGCRNPPTRGGRLKLNSHPGRQTLCQLSQTRVGLFLLLLWLRCGWLLVWSVATKHRRVLHPNTFALCFSLGFSFTPFFFVGVDSWHFFDCFRETVVH